MARYIESHAGTKIHLGKTQCWFKSGGKASERISELNVPNEEPVWKGDLPAAKNNFIVLRISLGCKEFNYVKGQKRITEEELLLSALPQLPDLQCAWLLLYFSAVPRANHLLQPAVNRQPGFRRGGLVEQDVSP